MESPMARSFWAKIDMAPGNDMRDPIMYDYHDRSQHGKKR